MILDPTGTPSTTFDSGIRADTKYFIINLSILFLYTMLVLLQSELIRFNFILFMHLTDAAIVLQ